MGRLIRKRKRRQPKRKRYGSGKKWEKVKRGFWKVATPLGATAMAGHQLFNAAHGVHQTYQGLQGAHDIYKNYKGSGKLYRNFKVSYKGSGWKWELVKKYGKLAAEAAISAAIGVLVSHGRAAMHKRFPWTKGLTGNGFGGSSRWDKLKKYGKYALPLAAAVAFGATAVHARDQAHNRRAMDRVRYAPDEFNWPTPSTF